MQGVTEIWQPLIRLTLRSHTLDTESAYMYIVRDVCRHCVSAPGMMLLVHGERRGGAGRLHAIFRADTSSEYPNATISIGIASLKRARGALICEVSGMKSDMNAYEVRFEVSHGRS